ncbi:hypothetical protein HYV57_00995 [Candidatus Peregrinibacteria bacterium]|nr:hypothetical protein [Candidatus Peregrinibacteria bacterium]
MTLVEKLTKDIESIKVRNKRVESDKAWELSWTRKVVILILTYLVIVIFFFVSGLPEPFLNAIVPSLAFVLSTLTLNIIKNWWLKSFHTRNH